MPSLRNILHKRDELTEPTEPPATPEFKLIRSDTHTQEIITTQDSDADLLSSPTQETRSSPRRSFQLFNRSSRAGSASSQSPPRRERRLSTLLHLDSRSRSNSRDSVNLPADLPQIEDDQGASKQEREAQWEKRATVLVQRNPQFGYSGSSLPGQVEEPVGLGVEQARSRSSSRSRVVSDPDTDVGCVYLYFEVVELMAFRSIFKKRFDYMKLEVSSFNIYWVFSLTFYTRVDLERSTHMFGQLADPNGANNPLSQVLFGLALR